MKTNKLRLKLLGCEECFWFGSPSDEADTCWHGNGPYEGKGACPYWKQL